MEKLEEEAKKIGIEFVGVPHDVSTYNLAGKPLLNFSQGCPVVLSVKHILARIEPVD